MTLVVSNDNRGVVVVMIDDNGLVVMTVTMVMMVMTIMMIRSPYLQAQEEIICGRPPLLVVKMVGIDVDGMNRSLPMI